jgi:threonine synthase
VEKLIIASNQNDILTRCVESGTYHLTGVSPSLSPSMDIQVSSNFERLLFNLHNRDGARIRTMMKDFRDTGSLKLSAGAVQSLRADFLGFKVDDVETLATIQRIHTDAGYLLDPHTAVGVRAAELALPKLSTPVITLATAHPAKFPDAVKKATRHHPALPAHLADLFRLRERYDVLENNADAVRAHIEKHA